MQQLDLFARFVNDSRQPHAIRLNLAPDHLPHARNGKLQRSAR